MPAFTQPSARQDTAAGASCHARTADNQTSVCGVSSVNMWGGHSAEKNSVRVNPNPNPNPNPNKSAAGLFVLGTVLVPGYRWHSCANNWGRIAHDFFVANFVSASLYKSVTVSTSSKPNVATGALALALALDPLLRCDAFGGGAAPSSPVPPISTRRRNRHPSVASSAICRRRGVQCQSVRTKSANWQWQIAMRCTHYPYLAV